MFQDSEVVKNLQDIVSSHRLEIGINSVCPVDHCHLLPGQSFVGHTVGIVCHVEVQILINAEVIIVFFW